MNLCPGIGPAMPAAVTTPMDQLLKELEIEMRAKTPEVLKSFLPGLHDFEIDRLEQIAGVKLAPDIRARFPNAIFFGGQIVFKEDTFFTRLLHNYVVFTLQRAFYRIGIPFMIMPLLVEGE